MKLFIIVYMLSDRLMCNATSSYHPLSSYHAMLSKCTCVNIEERVHAHAGPWKMERERIRFTEYYCLIHTCTIRRAIHLFTGESERLHESG